MCDTAFAPFSSFSSQQAIDSEVRAEAVPSVTVKVLCLAQTVTLKTVATNLSKPFTFVVPFTYVMEMRIELE